MSLKGAKIMEGIFFAWRLILAIIIGIFPGLVCKLLLTQLSSEDFQFCKILGIVIPIGFGALTDLIWLLEHTKRVPEPCIFGVLQIFSLVE